MPTAVPAAAGKAKDAVRRHTSRVKQSSPPVPDQDHHLVHEEEHLQVGLDGLPAPALRGRIENHRRSRHPDRAARRARGEPGPERPAPSREPLGIEAGPLEQDDHDEDPADDAIEDGRRARHDDPDTERRAQDGAQEQIGHALRREMPAHGQEDGHGEHDGVDGEHGDGGGRRHEIRQKGHGHEGIAESGEPQHQAGRGHDEGTGGPVECHRAGTRSLSTHA